MGKQPSIGVIGGSGIYSLKGLKIVKEHKTVTPFGKTSDVILEAELGGVRFYFLPRHGRNHSIAPSEINFRANIFALKKIGVRYLVSISAVGSLKEELSPSLFVLPDQFIDWTKGLRKRTFFEKGIVGHVSVANPIDLTLQTIIAESLKNQGIGFSQGGSYLCIEGPQFSTRAESRLYRDMGASVIGMTNVPEAFLAKEAGMSYATVAMVTDYDCWKEEHCTLEEILRVMKGNSERIEKLMIDLLPRLNKNLFPIVTENKMAVITKAKKLTKKHKEILKVLLS